ncbi:hypothetical protein G6F31_021875 [Rhizopus arrhizus]|nr:hypothetical protein G6F31_021875 [Rhizopus arrhizus]
MEKSRNGGNTSHSGCVIHGPLAKHGSVRGGRGAGQPDRGGGAAPDVGGHGGQARQGPGGPLGRTPDEPHHAPAKLD